MRETQNTENGITFCKVSWSGAVILMCGPQTSSINFTRNLLEMQIHWLHPTLTESETASVAQMMQMHTNG